MNEYVKNSIEARKSAIYNNYNINDVNTDNMIKDYFKRLEDYANNYDDVVKFETDFVSSPFASEYNDIFVKIMNGNNSISQTIEHEDIDLKEEIKDDIKGHVRHKTREEVDSALRDTPVVKDILNIKQHIDFFNKFKKKDK